MAFGISGSRIIPGISKPVILLSFRLKDLDAGVYGAVGSDGQESEKSDWWNFNYTI